MHLNMIPDALPGSARFVHALDRWPNDCLEFGQNTIEPKIFKVEKFRWFRGSENGHEKNFSHKISNS